MKEVRITEVPDGISLAIRCCGDRFWVSEGAKAEFQPFTIPAVENISTTFRCLECKQVRKQTCTVSYNDGFYTLEFDGLTLVYNGEQICLVGKCYCGYNNLKDIWTGEVAQSHCVNSTWDGEYEFECPCKRTILLVVRKEGKHFHLCDHRERPRLTKRGKISKGS